MLTSIVKSLNVISSFLINSNLWKQILIELTFMFQTYIENTRFPMIKNN